MVSAFLIGIPALFGLTVGGPFLQFTMRSQQLSLKSRVCVEAGLMISGAATIAIFPPGHAGSGVNWGKLVIALMAAASGLFGMIQGEH